MTQQTAAVLSSQWQDWIKDNLTRGCLVTDMVQAMVQSGFDAAFARRAIEHSQVTGAPQKNDEPPLPPRMPQTGNTLRARDREVRVRFRLRAPVVAVLDNVLSHDECDELVRMSRDKPRRSAVVNPATGKDKVMDGRSSFGTYFLLAENDFIARLDARIADLMHWPMENGEGLQILHYLVGGEYKPHYDYFPNSDAGSALHLAQGGQRVSTLVIYLNDVEEGGGTAFPEVGLTVTPKKGSAVYFEYCDSLGQIDALTLHSGLPVEKGEKWVATKWMRQRVYGAAGA